VSTFGIQIEPTDKNMDNLAGQRFQQAYSPNGSLHWANISGTKFIVTCNLLTHKTTSRIQATVNRTRQVDLIRPLRVQETTHDSEQYDTPSHPPQAEDWLTKVRLPKFQTLQEVTRVYYIDGKCAGIITPQCLNILHDAYNSARHQGKHALLIPPVQDLTTESMDYFTDSHDFQWQATIPRLSAHNIRLSPPSPWWQPFTTTPW